MLTNLHERFICSLTIARSASAMAFETSRASHFYRFLDLSLSSFGLSNAYMKL